jgi:hypothetical protein
MKRMILILPIVAMSACGQLPFGKSNPAMQPTDAIEARPLTRPLSSQATRPAVGARTASTLDTTSDAEKAAALSVKADPAAETVLGTTAVTLGLVTEPGFWLRSALVKVAGEGRVQTDTGASIKVDLIPGEGAAQLSLAAFRALDLSLTSLPEVTVLQN